MSSPGRFGACKVVKIKESASWRMTVLNTSITKKTDFLDKHKLIFCLKYERSTFI